MSAYAMFKSRNCLLLFNRQGIIFDLWFRTVENICVIFAMVHYITKELSFDAYKITLFCLYGQKENAISLQNSLEEIICMMMGMMLLLKVMTLVMRRTKEQEKQHFPHTICTRYAFVAFICGKIATDLAIHILYGFCTSNGAFLLLPMNQSWRIRKNESHKSTRIYTINKTKQNKTKRGHVLYHVHTTMYRYQLPIDSVPT